MFRKLEINIPFIESLAQMPYYAKFMKEILNKKRKLDDYRIVNLSINCGAIIQKKLPQKMQDLEASLYPALLEIMNLGKHFVTLVLVLI